MINYIDFTQFKYEKKLPQALEPVELAKELNKYFKKHKKYNIYSLALHLNMSDQRFTSQYLKNSDRNIQYLAHQAVSAIAAHALDNEEDYKRSLRYILARQNTGKDFIELSDEVQEANQNKVIILPSKNKD